MTVPLRTRANLKAAGRQMATEAVAALAAHYATLRPDEMTEALEDRLLAEMAFAMHATAESYRSLGVPAPWIAKFRSTFIRTAGEGCRALGLTLLPAAGSA
ncbi:hypothetical protein [Methylobacterium gnaphalii]|uniref:Uncharacterized protein n=1 Tax=Methylobacterium gnaphalii TaxID=1010610 RepID=A0A512JH27_9HYPH|nr:hypothetical protein [Methylobacterium gnaphalii]GEP09279.1 hypothetical protein MGN01_11240 [Methylobacterium gnaphalii]GJD69060.1 hypothetical protein MMMDOFMJ_1986 [Methylobacterium gnaphalii]GLS50988.1 hypothetical protein GCM10007885_38420 [Methylobacterium gnaphalii]